MSLRPRHNLIAATFLLSATTALAQTIDGDGLCEIIKAHTPDGTEACLANRSEDPSDKSFVLITRNSTDLRAFLLRSDLPGGGDCRAPSGGLSSFRCIPLRFETPPDYDTICNFRSQPVSKQCFGSARKVSYYNVSANVVPPGTGGVNGVASERFFAAARGLRASDVSVTEMNDALVYRGAATSESVPIRFSRENETSPTLSVRPPAGTSESLREVLESVDALDVPLSNLVALGVGGRFVAKGSATLTYFGTTDDCNGACERRELLSEDAFNAKLADFASRVPIEASMPELRTILIDRLLLGPKPYAPIDMVLDEARVRQPAAFLILKWD